MALLIGTPAYNGMIHMDHENTIMDLFRSNLNFDVLSVCNESLITRARNTIISFFKAMSKYTYLLWLDGDIRLWPPGLKSMLDRKVGIIGAPVRLKGIDRQGDPVYNYGEIIEDLGDGLRTTTKVGNAVMLMTREVVEALCDEAESRGAVYGRPVNQRGEQLHMPQYDVFGCGVVNGEYLSEDYFICNTLRKLGYQIYLDTNVQCIHHGMYGFGEESVHGGFDA